MPNRAARPAGGGGTVEADDEGQVDRRTDTDERLPAEGLDRLDHSVERPDQPAVLAPWVHVLGPDTHDHLGGRPRPGAIDRELYRRVAERCAAVVWETANRPNVIAGLPMNPATNVLAGWL